MSENKQTAVNESAKQKAVEIYQKMYKVRSNSASDITKHFAKQCTLIAVEYILKSCPTEPSKDGFSFSQTVAHTTNFWQQVRSEIDKL